MGGCLGALGQLRRMLLGGAVRKDQRLLELAMRRTKRGVARRRRNAQAVHASTSTSRDQASDDDVLLETHQIVLLALDGRFGEHSRGLLERGRRDEAAG